MEYVGIHPDNVPAFSEADQTLLTCIPAHRQSEVFAKDFPVILRIEQRLIVAVVSYQTGYFPAIEPCQRNSSLSVPCQGLTGGLGFSWQALSVDKDQQMAQLVVSNQLFDQ